MRDLCSKCLDLHTTEGFPASTDGLSENQSKTSVICGRFQETLQDLIDSAAGTSSQRKCNLCALLLWSWRASKSSTDAVSSNQAHLVLLILSNRDGHWIFLSCGEREGFPLKLSVDSSRFPSIVFLIKGGCFL